ncbi:sigma factor-like helix-turn-helix DNA-binding protein [Pseudomonadota bacterium]
MKNNDVPKWGEFGAPLLPSNVTSILGAEGVPNWLRNELGISQLAKIAALSEPKDRNSLLPHSSAAVRFAVNFVKTHLDQIHDISIIPDGGMQNVPLDSIRFSNRVIHRLKENQIWDLELLRRLVVRDLLRIPALGVVSMLDFMCTLEAAMVHGQLSLLSEQEEPIDLRAQIAALIDASQSDWADKISAEDSRFRDAFSPGWGSYQDRVERIISRKDVGSIIEIGRATKRILEVVEEVNSKLLEDQLEDFFGEMSGFPPERRRALLQRFGWLGAPPLTLEETGRLLDITRERVRQIEKKLREQFPRHRLYMPALEKAVKILEDNTPLRLNESSDLLKAAKLTNIDFHPKSIIKAASDCNIPSSLRLQRVKGEYLLFSKIDEKQVDKIAQLGRSQCASSGMTSTSEITSQANDGGLEIDESQVAKLLRSIDEFQFVSKRWFWCETIKPYRNRLINQCRKMLSVTTPIHFGKLRQGLKREYRFRNSANGKVLKWSLIVPPEKYLRKFLEANPSFHCDEKGYVSSSSTLDYKEELGESDRIVVEALRSSPSGLMDRQSLRDECLKRGINPNTFDVSLTYSCVVEHITMNTWGLIGADISTASVEAMRVSNAEKGRKKRVMGYGWTDEGKIWVSVIVPGSTANPVLGIPAGVKKFLCGKHFSAASLDGIDYGTVGVNEAGTAFGFGRFLQQKIAEKGDTLLLVFDHMSRTVELDLGDSNLINQFE